MKKIVLAALLCAICAVIFAASYAENDHLSRAREYTREATEAYEAGDYDQAIELSRLAEEEAELMRAYIQNMISKPEAEKRIGIARNDIAAAESSKAKANSPAFADAKTEFDTALSLYDEGNYKDSADSAQRVIDTLAGLPQAAPLPKYYVVRAWPQANDCLWNIAGRPYIYGNPRFWGVLYQANKDILPDPRNPNLISVGLKLLIPSVSGEFRDGTYDPGQQYESFKQ